MNSDVTIGVSFKAYFGTRQAREWCAAVAERVGGLEYLHDGTVKVFVIPSYLQIPAAIKIFEGTPIMVGAQDVSAFGVGPFTGEITAAELSEAGVQVVEIGHAERRRLFDETDLVSASKAAAAVSQGLTPVLCIGEAEPFGPPAAALANVEQLRASLERVPAGPVIVAYEPVWAIGAATPAPETHIRVVARSLRAALDADPDRVGSSVIYGGSAGPGLLKRLGGDVDGLFLGRFAHDPENFLAVLNEASELVPTAKGH